MEQYQLVVALAAGALTLIAFGGKIWNAICRGFRWVFWRPHEEIKGTMEDRCIELDNKIQQVSDLQEEKILEMDAMKDGILAMLHDKIFQSCKYFLAKGSISADELENLEYLFNGYAGLNGNGTCETLFVKVKNLDIKENSNE